jgi:hypothetical protein
MIFGLHSLSDHCCQEAVQVDYGSTREALCSVYFIIIYMLSDLPCWARHATNYREAVRGASIPSPVEIRRTGLSCIKDAQLFADVTPQHITILTACTIQPRSAIGEANPQLLKLGMAYKSYVTYVSQPLTNKRLRVSKF